MPAAVESMVSVREIPWHGLGEIVEDKLTAGEALKAARLNWKVSKEPLFVQTGEQYVEIEDRFAIQRSSDKKVLGVVGKPFNPLQNAQAFDFMDALVDSGDAKYETAGSLRGGRWVFLTMKVPEGIKISGKDPVDLYLALFNAHDGTKAITGMVTPIRVVCVNTLMAALGSAPHKWTVRHVGSLDGKLAEARRQLELTFDYGKAFEAEMDKLAQQSFTDSQFEQLVKGLKINDKTAAGLLANWEHSETIDRANKWDALNAVGEYFDWVRQPRSANARVMSTWFGQGNIARNRALALLK